MAAQDPNYREVRREALLCCRAPSCGPESDVGFEAAREAILCICTYALVKSRMAWPSLLVVRVRISLTLLRTCNSNNLGLLKNPFLESPGPKLK